MIGGLMVDLMEKVAGSPGPSSMRFGAPKVPTPKVSMPKPPAPASLISPSPPTIKRASEENPAGYEGAGVVFPEAHFTHWRSDPRIRRYGDLARLGSSGPMGAMAALLTSGALSQPKMAAVRSVVAFLDELEG